MSKHSQMLMLVVASCLLLVGCRREEPVDLVIVSPHNEFVQQEFEKAFQAWHQQRFGRSVRVQWREIGGTTQITGYIVAQYEKSDSSGIDIFFGGGAPAHERLAGHGVLEPVTLPAETLEQIPEFIRGVRQRDAEGRWFGACVSSFGILYNAKLAEQMNVAPPTSWDDMADPGMVDLVCTAGPKSGSARAAYELILQSASDWPAGWRRLLSFWGNCRSFTQGASDVPGLVADGEVVAGTCIDYYAFGAISRSGTDVLRYALPDESAVFTPDPIGVLKGAPHPEMAERFVRFVLSPAGQSLWALPPGTEGGPVKHALYRQPIRKDTYERYADRMLDDLVNPYEFAGEFVLDRQVQLIRASYILPRLMRAAAMDNAQSLRKAWRLLVAKGRPDDLTAVFASLPDDLATFEAMLATGARIAELEDAGDTVAIQKIESAWRAFFRDKYDEIIAAQ